MAELPLWKLHTLEGKKEVLFINGIATYGESYIMIDNVRFGLIEFTMVNNYDEYTLKGVVYEEGTIDPINIFINFNKLYIILGK
ncbi:hypothetical protein [Enterococcus phage vB_Efs19_KEN07]